MENSQTLFCSSKFPWAHDRISSKFIANLDTRPQKVSSALFYDIRRTLFYNFFTRNARLFHSGYRPIPAAICTSCVACAGSGLATG
jgi:hypothetical protein